MSAERNLGFPEGTGKRYSAGDLENFYGRAEARYEELFPQVKLQRFVNEFKTQPHTQEAVTAIWGNMWEVMGGVTGSRITVAECDRTNEEIAELEANGRMLVYVPKELSGADQAKRLLPLVLPDPQAQKANNLSSHAFVNVVEQSGWVSVEATPRLPHSKVEDEVVIRDRVESGELQGQTVNTYLVGTLFSRLMNGSYLDEGNQYPYAGLVIGSRMNDAIDGKPARYIPYVQSSTDKEGNMTNLLFWSWGGDMSPRQLRTAELKNPTTEQQDKRKYRWNMNVLLTPPTADEWNERLESNTGAQVAELLKHIHELEQLLHLERPVDGAISKVRQALAEVGANVRTANTVTIEQLQAQAARAKVGLADYMSWHVIASGKYLDHLVYPFVKANYDVTKSVRLDIDFFDKLWEDGVQDRFVHRSGASGTFWRTFRQAIGYEADLVAAGKPEEAAKITPFREICEAGNYPIGLDNRGSLIIVTA